MAGGAETSPVISINGQDPTYFLQANIGVTVGLQDPDARYLWHSIRPVVQLTQSADLGLRAKGTTVFSLPLPQGLKEDTAGDIGPTIWGCGLVPGTRLGSRMVLKW